MSVSRSLGSLVVRIAAEGIGAYKSDLNTAADATSQAAGKMETSANKAGKAAQLMGGQLGASAAEVEALRVVAGAAGLGVTALAAGFGLAAVAAYQGAKEKQAYAKSLILTGNAAGVTTGQLADMAKGISSSVGTTGQAAAALAAMAGSGAVAGGSLQKFSQVAIEMERTVGTKVADTVKQFEALGDAPVAASIKLNQSMNYLTASTFAQIKAAQELGDMESAASIAQNAYANAVTQRVAAVEGTLGTLQKAWRGAGEMAKWAWDKMMNLGREQGPEQALAAQRTTVQNLEAQLAKGGLGARDIEKPLAAAREALGIMQENVRLEERSAQAQAKKSEVEKAGIAGVTAVTAANTKALDKQEQMNRALVDYSKSLAAIKEADPASKLLKPELIAKTEAAIRAQFADKGGRGGSAAAKVTDYERMAEAMAKTNALSEQELALGGKLSAVQKFRLDELQKINFAYASHKISLVERDALFGKLEKSATLLSAVEQMLYKTDAIQKNNDALDKLLDGKDKSIEAMVAANEQQRLENETIGLSAEALNALTLRRLDNSIALQQEELLMAQNTERTDDNTASIQRNIDQLERSIRLKQTQRDQTSDGQTARATAEFIAKANKEAEDAQKDYEKKQIDSWNTINDKAESVFLDFANNGTSAFKRLESELKNGLLKLLYEMTVKKWIISIGSDMAGFDISGLLGGGSGGGDIWGKLFSKGSEYLFGGGDAAMAASTFSGGAGGFVGPGAAASVVEAAGALEGLGAAAVVAEGGAVAAGAGLGGMAAAALAAIPVVGWVALGIGALFAIFGSGKDKIPTVLNDLNLFNQSLAGLPFQEVAYSSDEAAQGLRDVLYGLENATPAMRRLAGETIQLTGELMRAQGNVQGARDYDRNIASRGLSKEELAMYDYNQALKDKIQAERDGAAAASAGAAAAQAAEQAENTLAQTRYDLAGRLNVLLGRQTQQQFDRATELAAATDASVIAMLNEIYKIEDLTAARDASFATLERSIAKEKEIANLRLKTATDLQSALKTAKDAISPSLDRASAQSQIAMYVALAKAGGVLPTAAALKPALDAIAKPSEDLFRTFEDYALDQAHTANDISDLAGFADAQVSEAQQAIERLDLQLETAKNQLDVLKGVDNSVLSVAEAVRNFEASMLAVAKAQASAGNYSFTAPVASSSYSGGGGGGGYSGGGAASAASATAGMDSDIVAAYNAYYGRNPDQGGYDSFVKSGLTGDAMMQAILRASIADKSGADYNYAMAHGFDPDSPTANFYHGKGAYKATAAVMENYAVGSNYIDRDQIAQIHRGEEITPRPYVDMQRASRDESNALMARLVASNERLEQKVESLQKAADKGNENTKRTADTLQGQQGVPFLVEIAQ